MTIIPEAARKKHLAILGINGSGKSSADRGDLIEPALAAGERVCIIDPKGEAWGLRLGANGKPKGGYPIYIVGGERGDFPLNDRDGTLWAEVVASSSDSFAFDVSQMTVGRRTAWFTAFAETLLRKNKGPLNLTIDEVHLFAPQSGARGGGDPALLHATNNLLALGRSKGLRVRMISQRPAKVHKDALTQAHTLVAMMMIAPHDKRAVEEWIEGQADPARIKEIVNALPTLKPGEAFVYAPREGMLERVRFPMPKTYDSSKAPDEVEEAVTLTPIDPAALTERLAKVAEEAKTNDPAVLKAEVARLKSALEKLQGAPAADPKALAEGQEEAFRAGMAFTARAATAAAGAFQSRIRAAVGEIIEIGDFVAIEIDALANLKPPAGALPAGQKRPASGRTPEPAPKPLPTPARPLAAAPAGEGVPTGPLLRILNSIRWWNDLGVAEPSHPQVAFAADYSHKSGTWATYLSRLRSNGWIMEKGALRLTGAGAAFTVPNPGSRDEIRSIVLAKIDAPLAKILRPLLEAYPESLSHEEVAAAAVYSHKSGTWATYLSRLRSLDLIEKSGPLKAQGWLFP